MVDWSKFDDSDLEPTEDPRRRRRRRIHDEPRRPRALPVLGLAIAAAVLFLVVPRFFGSAPDAPDAVAPPPQLPASASAPPATPGSPTAPDPGALAAVDGFLAAWTEKDPDRRIQGLDDYAAEPLARAMKHTRPDLVWPANERLGEPEPLTVSDSQVEFRQRFPKNRAVLLIVEPDHRRGWRAPTLDEQRN